MTDVAEIRPSAAPAPPSAGHWCAEGAAAVTVASFVSVGLQFLVARIPVPEPSHLPRALLATATVLVLAAVVGLFVRGRVHWSGRATVASWSALSAVSTLGLALPLHGTSHYLGGTAVDQEFRLQFLTRLTDSPILADMNYADLPTYYPAGWFWVGGRLADILGIPGWEAYKPYAIVTIAVASAITFTAWSLLVPRTAALLVALATATIGLLHGAYEPYSWILATLLPAVAVLAWRHIGRRSGPRWSALVAIGVYAGLCTAVYTLFTALTGFLILVMVAVAGSTGRVPWAPLGGRLLVVMAAAAPLALPQWLPYLTAWVVAGMPSGSATRFLPLDSAQLPLPMLEFDVLGMLCLAGVVWMAARLRRDPVAQGLALLTGTCYAWFTLSTAAVAVGQTLLAFRLEPIVEASLVSAGVLGVLDGLARVITLVGDRDRQEAVTYTATVLAVAAGVTVIQSVPANSEAYSSYYPSGVAPLGEPDPTNPASWNDELVAAIDRGSALQQDDVTLLTSHGAILSFSPFRSFLTSTPHYSNPLADHTGRRAVVEQWARTDTPAELVAALDASPYRPPTVFVLRTRPDGLRMPMSRDLFPREPNVEGYEVTFDPAVFVGPEFRTETVGPFTVAFRSS